MILYTIKIFGFAVLLCIITAQEKTFYRLGALIQHKINGPDVQEAKPGQFPWCFLISDPCWKCAGNLISNDWILTAAHCMLGCPSVTENGLIGCIKHPNFKEHENDIGLVKLYKPIEYNDTIKPIRMADENYTIGENVAVVAAGWGSDTSKNVTLKFAEMRTISLQECEKAFGTTLIDSIICTKPPNGPCHGDGGGGLIHYKDNDIPTLVGVVSFVSSEGCENASVAGYSKVSSFRKWIKEVSGV